MSHGMVSLLLRLQAFKEKAELRAPFPPASLAVAPGFTDAAEILLAGLALPRWLPLLSDIRWVAEEMQRAQRAGSEYLAQKCRAQRDRITPDGRSAAGIQAERGLRRDKGGKPLAGRGLRGREREKDRGPDALLR